MPGIYVQPADLVLLHDFSASQASRTMTLLKDVFNKVNHQKVTVWEYCEYYGITVENYYEGLELARNRLKNSAKIASSQHF